MKTAMKSTYFITIVCLLLFVSCTQVEIAQWRGLNRDGIYPETNLLEKWPEGGPQLLWKFDSLGYGYSSAAVTSDRVFTAGTIDSISYLFSFDLNGRLLWKSKIGRDWMVNWPGIRSTPSIYKNSGYVLTGLGVLYCFHTDDGSINWSKDVMKEFEGVHFRFGFSENLIVDEEKVYCTTAGNNIDVVALDRRTGKTIWKSVCSNDAQAYGSPILIPFEGKTIYVNQTQKSIFALNTKNGELVWRYELKTTRHANTPIYRDGKLFVIDGFGAGSFMLQLSKNGESIKEVWKNDTLDITLGDAVVINNRIYCVTNKKGIFRCVDWDNGKDLFPDTLKSYGGTLISDGRLIYCYDQRGKFTLRKPLDRGFDVVGLFQVLGGTDSHCSQPVIKNGRLYIRHDNSLFVYNISK